MSDKIPFTVETGSPLERYERSMFTGIMIAVTRSLRGESLSLAQVAALHVLDMRPHMRVGEIAELLGMQLPGASKLAADLVDRGLCARLHDPGDRRAKLITLTAAGRELIVQMSKRRALDAPQGIAAATDEVGEIFRRTFQAMHEAGLTSAPRERPERRKHGE